ncbi:MAG TPA: sugar phosphate isomerase/epimerase family protein [Spirochaetia bacterium]|nr:sugar phosphate isomerase/epimerase family protein [Spirochaetia bacterium]
MKKGIRRAEFFPREWSLDACFEAASDYGFRGMELIFRSGLGPVVSGIRRDPEVIPDGYHGWQTLQPSVTFATSQDECLGIRKTASHRGIEICSLASGYSTIDRPGTDRYKQTRDFILSAVVRCNWLGGSSVLVSFEKADTKTSDAEARQWVVALLREIEPSCRRFAVQIAYELVWPAIYHEPAELRALFEAVGSLFVGCYYDPANIIQTFSRAGEIRSNPALPWLQSLRPYVRSVHLKDFSVERGPADLLDGDVDWPGVRRILAETGYQGWLVAETEVEPAVHTEGLERVSRAVDRFITGSL